MSKAKALVIDDNLQNIAILVRLLSNEGMSSVQVVNPSDLDSALQQDIDLRVIFLDLEMPGIDGYQVLTKLRSDARFDSVPIIAYTVHINEINEAHRRGFDGFVGKPLDSSRFPDQLARILAGDPVWEAV